MFGNGFVAVVLFAVLAGVIAAGVVVGRGSRQRSSSMPISVAREWRLVQLTRWCGIALGVLAAVAVAHTGSSGTGAMLVPAVLGLCVLVATAVGETVVRPSRPPGARSADLATRRVREYLPRPFAAVVATMLVLELATLALTTATASRDESSGDLRSLACTGPGVGAATSPYPGAFYAVPLAIALLLAVTVAAVAAVRVVRRPRGMATTIAGDDGLRRRSLGVVVAALGVAVCGPQTGVSVVAGFALGRLSDACAAGWMHPVGVGLGCVAVLSGGVTLICLGRVLVGSAHAVGAQQQSLAAPVG